MASGSEGKDVHASPFSCRRAGILLHPTSLPDGDGQGGLGQSAHRFVDFLAASGISVWQMLPLGPTHSDRSPYQCLSVFAGNPDLISFSDLKRRGWLASGASGQESNDLLRAVYEGFQQNASEHDRGAYHAFRDAQAHWLDDYALYQAIRLEHGRSSWLHWPEELRDREPAAMDEAKRRQADAVELIRFEQFLFHDQWHELKRYANQKGVLLFGDLPIFVAYDSAEVWAHREYFTLDAHGRAETVAGVPPDYFSATGQRWGNPHYRWDRMQDKDFDWWRQRIKHQLELVDLLRIDHFRGFESYWAIPADAETAVNGHWVRAPGDTLFQTLQREFNPLPLVAEDLGLITPEVEALRHRYRLPGMKVLQFAFDSDAENPYLPHNHERDYVVYTGTHDNNTTLGWFEALDADQQRHVLNYLGSPGEAMPWPLIRSAYASVAALAVVPMQDVLGLGEQDRMNTPGTSENNWQWQFGWEQVPESLPECLRGLGELYGRIAEE